MIVRAANARPPPVPITPTRPIFLRLCAAAASVAALGGCSSWLPGGDPIARWVPAYRIDIQQGNVVTREQIDKLKPGMTRMQVRDILGSPLIADPFHADRWDYIFTLDQPRKPLQRRSVVLIFAGDTLQDIEAGELPTEREFIASIARSSGGVKASALELTPEQVQALPRPPKAEPASAPAAADAPAGSPRSYPPLEPS
jgi:outer membrane protein assembly factor BamE